MAVIKSLISAFSTYSKLPMPNLSYKENEGRFTLIFFPLVGVVIGAVEYLWFLLGWKLNLEGSILCIGYMLIPLFITGGIHIDGFMDSMDAIHSFGNLDKKKKILEDPHIGAFCVIKLLELSGIWFIAIKLLPDYLDSLMFLGFIVSRILSAIGIFYLKNAKDDGMLYYTKTHSSRVCGLVLILELAAGFAFIFYEFELLALAPAIVSMLCLLYYKRKALKDFGGITGDTAGCFLVMTETAWILSISIEGLVQML